MSTADVSAALDALEALASTSATSSSGPLNALLEQHFAVARERILAGSPPKHVIAELQTNVAKAKKQVERGLKTWYAALGNTGKAVEKVSSASVASCISRAGKGRCQGGESSGGCGDHDFADIRPSPRPFLTSRQRTTIRPCSPMPRLQRRSTGSCSTLLAGGGCGTPC